jgi:hypothetical protein
MVLSPKAQAVFWAGCGASAVLLIWSCLPVWTVWHINTWEGVGYPGTLWQALAQLPSNQRNADPYPDLWALHGSNLMQGAIVVVLALAAALIVFGAVSRVHSGAEPDRS